MGEHGQQQFSAHPCGIKVDAQQFPHLLDPRAKGMAVDAEGGGGFLAERFSFVPTSAASLVAATTSTAPASAGGGASATAASTAPTAAGTSG